MANSQLVGQFVWLTGKRSPEPGEYFLLKETPFEFIATKLTGGYGTEVKRFNKKPDDPAKPEDYWRITDAYRDDEAALSLIRQVEYFAKTPERGEKAQWVGYVYSNAAEAARLARRALSQYDAVETPVLRTPIPVPGSIEFNGRYYDLRA